MWSLRSYGSTRRFLCETWKKAHLLQRVSKGLRTEEISQTTGKGLMRFILKHVPIAKKRHRSAIVKGKIKTYDEQSKEKRNIKCEILSQFKREGFLNLLHGPIAATMLFHTPIPKKVPQKRLKSIIGSFDITRPDIDNYFKMYADVMNELVYKDDGQIACIYSEKLYSDQPRVEITLTPLEGRSMIHEHVKTLKEPISIEDLNYMIKKANRLGRMGREIVRVFTEEDNEGKHLYFEVEGIKNADGN